MVTIGAVGHLSSTAETRGPVGDQHAGKKLKSCHDLGIGQSENVPARKYLPGKEVNLSGSEETRISQWPCQTHRDGLPWWSKIVESANGRLQTNE
jgi:hypothetical protein